MVWASFFNLISTHLLDSLGYPGNRGNIAYRNMKRSETSYQVGRYADEY